ncbi:MAG: GHKL domain-containing protein [Butyrivibrio sp.]|nr:GHKL domain-containing protein [Butyrivibrio sp.]
MIELFWRENILIGLLAVQLIVCHKLKKREYWQIKWLIMTVVLFLIADKLNQNWQWSGQTIVAEAMLSSIRGRIIVFLGTYIQMFLCYHLSGWNALYFLAISMSIQHIQFALYKIISEFITLMFALQMTDVQKFVLNLIIFAIYIVIVVLIFRGLSEVKIQKDQYMIVLLAVFLFICMEGISMYMYVKDPEFNYGTTLIAVKLMDVIYNIVMLCMLYNLLGKKVLEIENAALHSLAKQRSTQYAFTQELINTINIKTHDLKKQIRYFKNHENEIGDFLDDVENTVLLYDSIVHTNNDTLSAILTEKSMICHKEKIPFTCIADGTGIEFIKELDVYTLFANLMDNAIEASLEVPEGNRSISLIVKKQSGFISIVEENMYEKPPVVQDGFFKTIKDDVSNHGFGLKSMNEIVDKYNGNIKFEVNDNKFKVNILFSIPD